jgi:hypothetical protein
MTRLETLAETLKDRQWHTGPDLAVTVGHRFSAQLLQLRSGAYDGHQWKVKKERTTAKGVWRYQFIGRTTQPYEPQSPTCPNCGTKLHIRDDRA